MDGFAVQQNNSKKAGKRLLSSKRGERQTEKRRSGDRWRALRMASRRTSAILAMVIGLKMARSMPAARYSSAFAMEFAVTATIIGRRASLQCSMMYRLASSPFICAARVSGGEREKWRQSSVRTTGMAMSIKTRS